MSDTSTWSKESIIQAGLEWKTKYGKQPRSVEWMSGNPGFPSTSLVKKAFGSWNRFMIACGFEVKQPFARRK